MKCACCGADMGGEEDGCVTLIVVLDGASWSYSMPMFYFFFAAFTGFFDFAFLTIFNMKICLLPYKFMLVGLSYLPFIEAPIMFIATEEITR
jgi:hypothetical protein